MLPNPKHKLRLLQKTQMLWKQEVDVGGTIGFVAHENACIVGGCMNKRLLVLLLTMANVVFKEDISICPTFSMAKVLPFASARFFEIVLYNNEVERENDRKLRVVYDQSAFRMPWHKLNSWA